MILIADSGSTKTDWRFIDDRKKIHAFRTAGLNPYFLSSEQVAGIVREELIPSLATLLPGEIYFYGAGCSSESKQKIVRDGLQSIFAKAGIQVEDDLLGACRALSGEEPGLVAILGTGSNSCVYNGNHISERAVSLGFILGDEGSGSQMGKKLLQKILYREFPEAVIRNFDDAFHLSKDEVLESVYRKPLPNRFLASFTQFAFQHREEPAIADVVNECFSEFFDRHICRYINYKNYILHCTGSVAFYFSELLKKTAEKKSIRLGKITESPIEGLTDFHLR